MIDFKVWHDAFCKSDGTLAYYNKPVYDSCIDLLKNKQVKVYIKEVKRKTSHETHGYYRGVILHVAQQSEMFRGWKLDEIHKYFASEFLKDVIEKKIGETTVLIVTTISTADTDQKRMNEFITDVRIFLEQNGINTPDPE